MCNFFLVFWSIGELDILLSIMTFSYNIMGINLRFLNICEYLDTGKSLSEAFIFASTNSHYDDRLFIELQVQYMKIPSSNLGRTCCVQKLFLRFRTIFVHNMFWACNCQDWTGNSMNKLWSYCGLVDAKIRFSDKDIPVLVT